MPMLKDPSKKYVAFKPLNLPDRQWPSKTLQAPPRWLSTDLRDGNQSLPDPMSVAEKKEYFNKLVQIGFKEIEVAFPSASQTDFDFTRYAVENAPADVAIQVLSPCRPELIKRTVESLKGAKKAIVHIYLATSDCFRNIIFGLSQEESLEMAVNCTKLVRELTKDAPEMQDTVWGFEFSPETFSDTDPDYALRVCEAVKAAWGPSEENPIIFNLPATVEMSTPNVYADQIEYFSRNISERKTVAISLHPHNDRGCAVAAAELGQMAGADRIEGCLFGNGERTGNVDLVTLALNLYTQGVYPHLDFSDITSVIDIVERCNKIPVHPRAPYGGQLVVCAFSGSHQDAIKKGFKKQEERQAKDPNARWQLPYLPLDPQDIGRTYEAIIRVNSQSGKGGASWVILRNLELDLPRALQVSFSKIVQNESEVKGRELYNKEITNLFKNSYFVDDDDTQHDLYFQLVDYSITNTSKSARLINVELQVGKDTVSLKGIGNGPISSFASAISSYLKKDVLVLNYHEHSLGKDSNSKAATYLHCAIGDDCKVWGVGIHEDVSQASFLSFISLLNSARRDGKI
ncbi:2-isopropylmalate synthase involved in leucine biosynthesis pathway [Komagataella phaffii]|uniref:2-isopropylmalate synthase n=1 Tax=Komagataella phaffii (strain GS115 / ATCC 20864) TaxID=644223 RepID=C4R0L2_KOMPG|nr:Alpha-isopropylmalate synthase (2-isopropylmalate synthase) [Komagataella phaffii GS115]AOA63126.1 GQ67_00456T0 [Komagataella phaffii]AOA67035.1 GQ68_00933T0 [Komagataella phaffii GS115]CAH2448445.1 2-isopropylmalate synthase LEU4 [Komagataella phaffii CBS 7435]CAY69036.1 Alpha-isopropylmalate synthase (2-isopropylmalate synthase) [Komagataella phaffii GS115]